MEALFLVTLVLGIVMVASGFVFVIFDYPEEYLSKHKLFRKFYRSASGTILITVLILSFLVVSLICVDAKQSDELNALDGAKVLGIDSGTLYYEKDGVEGKVSLSEVDYFDFELHGKIKIKNGGIFNGDD